MLKQYSKYDIATFIALVLHTCGLIGILFFDREMFTAATTINLLVMFVLLLWTQSKKNTWFFIFFIITYAAGFTVEWFGVNTSLLFGDYHYGNVMGLQFKNVPLIIGINWFIIIYCSGVTIYTILQRAITKIAEQTGEPVLRLKPLSVIVDGATLAVFFDWVMEPAAVKLGYWQWNTTDGSIPLLNYGCWFVISLVLVASFYLLKFNKRNKFAVHLLLIQLMFFLLLRTFL